MTDLCLVVGGWWPSITIAALLDSCVTSCLMYPRCVPIYLCLMSHHAHLDRAVGGHLVAARVHHRLALRVVRPVADLHRRVRIILRPRQTPRPCLLTLLYLRPHSSLYSMVYMLSITTVQFAWLELRQTE